MATTKRTYSGIRIEFDDGRTEDHRIDRPSTLLAFEREHGRSPSESVTDVFRLCYIVAGHPEGESEADFEKWANTIDTFESTTLDRPTKAPRSSSAA